MSDRKSEHDKALGMDRAVTRRDFLNSTLLASGALLVDLSPVELLAQVGGDAAWNGPGGVGGDGGRGAWIEPPPSAVLS